MLHPDTWSALADHSGDSLFEFCYIMDFPKALAAFRRHGGPAKWLRWYWRGTRTRGGGKGPGPNTDRGAAAHPPESPGEGEGGRLPLRPPDRGAPTPGTPALASVGAGE